MTEETTPGVKELYVLEQVHLALSSAHNLDDFYAITAGLLVSPDLFGFSRVFIIRYNEKTRQFQGRMALGARTAEEHTRFRQDQEREQILLQKQIATAEKESPEPAAIQQLYDLRFHTLWMQLMQGREEGTGLHTGFANYVSNEDDISEDHLFKQVASSSRAGIYEPSKTNIAGLERFFKLPLLAGRLKTRRGLHGLIVVDNSFQTTPLTKAFVGFQWLINHASLSLENVELLEESKEANSRLRELDRLKTNFLSIVSHELRTPLTSIIGFVHLLKEGRTGPVTEAQKDMLSRVSTHSIHLQNMVNDILEIAEVESGGIINVEPQAVDPLAVLWNVMPKVEIRRSSRDVTVEPVIDEAVPDVIADPNALERIYYHLLDNAIKFIPSSGRVTIHFKRSGDRLDITVADTGIGMHPDNLKRIFDQFYQVDYRLERAYGGMGIGLSVVRLLMDATGGSLRIESTPGEGSRFTVSFPLASNSVD